MALGDSALGSGPLGASRAEINMRSAPRVPTTGAIIGASVDVPASAAGEIEVLIDLDPLELLDTLRSLWCHLYEQMPDSSWRHVVGMEWRGGPNFDLEFGANHNPRFWFDASRIAGKTVRVEIDDPQGQQVGYKLALRT